MTSAGELFDYAAKAPSSNETTSKAAAVSVESHAARMAKRVLDHIRRTPSTCFEVEQATGLPHQTASARIRGLVLDGRVEDSGDKRPTESGRRAIVWRAK
jgi:predicted Rossmann fold nucleotide-binding protein DprA/Smf involved in DNA uptake